MKKSTKISLAAMLAVFIIFSVLYANGFLSSYEKTISDRLYSEKKGFDGIIIIAIDDKSIQSIGRWPWDRDVYAEYLERMKKAKVIGIDISFFEPSAKDEFLKKFIEKENIVLASEFSDSVLLKPIFNAQHGYANIYLDSDEVVAGEEACWSDTNGAIFSPSDILNDWETAQDNPLWEQHISKLKKVNIGYGKSYQLGMHLATMGILLDGLIYALSMFFVFWTPPFLFTIILIIMALIHIKKPVELISDTAKQVNPI